MFSAFNTFGKLGALASSVARAWSPADMPSLGAWYDPSDLSTMFQDAAGTTPVTAAGQPVGLILDKSGNGHHASQSTSTARPLFQIDGSGKHYLAFDGVDDYLSTSAIDLTGTDKVTVFAGIDVANDANSMAVEFSTNSDSNEGAFRVDTQDGFRVQVGPAWGRKLYGVSAPAMATYVLTPIMDMFGDGALLIRLNGSIPTQNHVVDSAVVGDAFGNHPLFIGARSGGVLPFNGNIYSLILGGTAYDAATVLEAEAWVADKSGVTL